jgi:MerR family transcriptional regulator, heat shock protein HspR
MTRRIIPRDLAARQLAVSTSALARYESLGLVQAIQEGSEEGYEPAQVRRLWSIVTYQRDLGINLAGVEVILHLVDHLSEVHHRVYDLAEELRELLEEGEPSSVADSHG